MARAHWAMLALATGLAACQQSAMQLTVPGATPISYETIRDGSGVLAFAETALPPDLDPRPPAHAGPGSAAVDRERVLGAWRLPADMDLEALRGALTGRGEIEHAHDFRDGQIATMRFRPNGGDETVLLMINGAHPHFATRQPPELRPAEPHRYLIAYRAD
ncbi:hypothetical protein [Sphingomonas lenta]|nr:hypothetical protein [Sphingomonas lenta]